MIMETLCCGKPQQRRTRQKKSGYKNIVKKQKSMDELKSRIDTDKRKITEQDQFEVLTQEAL